MLSNHWIETRKPHWERLQSLLQQCGNSGVSCLNRDELRNLTLLYRQVSADLSTARRDPSSAHYAQYLNLLLSRAHSIIYSGRSKTPASLFSFFGKTWPKLFWRLKNYLAVSLALFVLSSMAGVLVTTKNPDFPLQVLGPSMVDSIERHEMWTHSIVGMQPVASSHITTNNITVAFMTFAMGITAGIGTVYLIAFNGLLLGVVAAACGLNGMSLSLWTFVVAHGSLEIPAILIAGAAGLRLGAGLLFPGEYSRKDSVRMAGAEAVQLELGTIPLLIVAGLVEGFISPIDIPAAAKFSLGAALFTALTIWVLSGRPAIKEGSSA